MAVSDDADDAALQTLQHIADRVPTQPQLRTCIGPQANRCSQKIQNLLTGIQVWSACTFEVVAD